MLLYGAGHDTGASLARSKAETPSSHIVMACHHYKAMLKGGAMLIPSDRPFFRANLR